MRAELRRSIFLACVGLLGGFALVVALYGVSTLFKHGFGSSAIHSLADDPEAGQASSQASGEAGTRAAGEAPNPPGKPRADLSDRPPGTGTQAAPPMPGGPPSQSPTFDIIRVEPTGETVIAGRAAPNTTVELLRDNQPIARALVDPSGQFAIVPPALPAGNSEITLRGTGADGQGRTSRESVVVVVAPGRDTKPLIALTAPDKPTVVLSQPDPVGNGKDAPERAVAAGAASGRSAQSGAAQSKTAQNRAAPGKPAPAGTGSGTMVGKNPPDTAQAALSQPDGNAGAAAAELSGTRPVKIVSVEAEEGGKLYVTSQANPGATVRLYLNDALVAPGSVGPDGRVAFTIGRGIRPGDYKVRVDQVDPVSGTVKTRSEVAFTVPATVKPAPAKPTPPAIAAAARPAEPDGTAASGIPAVPQRMADVRSPAAPANQATTAPTAPTTATATTARPAEGAAADRPGNVFVPEIGTARIIRGDSLWQISRRIYGKGTRYTVIFDANQPQIRNPDLIYPGQIFVLPHEGTATVSQAEKRS